MESVWLMPTLASVGGVLLGTFLFFFATTRGALIVRSWMPGEKAPDAHVYPIYSSMRLIRLIDFQPIIAAILLFQYDRLVRVMTHVMGKMDCCICLATLNGSPWAIKSRDSCIM